MSKIGKKFKSVSITLILILAVFFVIGSVPEKRETAGEQALTELAGVGEQISVADLKELEITPVEKVVSEGAVSEKYVLKTKDDNLVEIGTERHSPPRPYLKLNKWEGEVSLKVNMPFETGDNPTIIGNKVRYSTADKPITANFWENLCLAGLSALCPIAVADADDAPPRIDIDIYPRQPEEITEIINGESHTSIQNENGGVEFDTILYERPSFNQIIFPIETKGLNFYYQPPLTEEWKAGDMGGRVAQVSETEVRGRDGNTIFYRPENVVGSYAVYNASQEKFFKTEEEGKKYKAGVAFHIYRPKVRDSLGNETWADLNIDAALSKMAITIPQRFLDSAVYPVIVDPNFGYEVAGTSDVSISGNIIGTRVASGGTGTGSSITARLGILLNQAKCALYDNSSPSNIITNGGTAARSDLTANDWNAFNFSTGPTIDNATYNIVVWGNGGYVKYNSVSGWTYVQAVVAYGDWPANVTWTTFSDYATSIYATYAAAGGATETRATGAIKGGILQLKGSRLKIK